jgi:hypothetical protein
MIPPVKSLADLEFRAKTDKRYQRLIVRAMQGYFGGSSQITWELALQMFHKLAKEDVHGMSTCLWLVQNINTYCDKILTDEEEAQKSRELEDRRKARDAMLKQNSYKKWYYYNNYD